MHRGRRFLLYQGLPREIYALFAGGAAVSLGNFLWPMQALLYTDHLELSKAASGFLLTLSMLAMAPGALAGGKLSDALGRRNVLLGCRLFTAASVGACAWLSGSPRSFPLIPWLLVIASVFRGAAEPVISALAADLTRDQHRQGAFSLLYLGSRLGFLGPLAGGLLFHRHMFWIFAGYALASLVSTAIIGLIIPKSMAKPPMIDAQPAVHEHVKTGGALGSLAGNPALILFAILSTAYSLVHSQHLFGLPLQLGVRYGTDGAGLYGTLISLNALAVVLLTPLATVLTGRISATTNLSIGGLLYAIGFGMLYADFGRVWLVVSTLIWTLGEIQVITHSQVFLFQLVPASHRGGIGSMVMLLSQSGYALGPWLTGWWIAKVGIQSVWPVCLVLGICVSTVIAVLGRVAGIPPATAADGAGTSTR